MKIILATVICIVCILEMAHVDAWRRRRRRRRSCYPVNCAWGNWQGWGACSISCGSNGTETRIRTVVRSASCGGAACTGPSQEQRVCSPGCIRGTAMAGYCANCPFPYTGNCCEQFIEGDPCTTHIELSQPWRSISYPPEQDNSYHYTNLLNYWYRFVGGGGGDMPTMCIKAKSCGVLKPIWMSGDHPTSDEGAVSRTVCTSVTDNGENNCCIRMNTIEVKNCTRFYVYKLFQPQDCDEGFCADKPCTIPIDDLLGDKESEMCDDTEPSSAQGARLPQSSPIKYKPCTIPIDDLLGDKESGDDPAFCEWVVWKWGACAIDAVVRDCHVPHRLDVFVEQLCKEVAQIALSHTPATAVNSSLKIFRLLSQSVQIRFTGKDEPCPPGTKSANGYTPNCTADPPPDTCTPQCVEVTGLFQCRFDVQYQRNITYDVNWYAAGIVLDGFGTSVFGSRPMATLGVQQLMSVLTISTTITCSLSARYIHVDGTPMSEATSPKESNTCDFVLT
ncbi:uncharacterized protein LOC117101360 [Anneissia japonica]|uniref:uncharacterized protein LOC117101360 n=1 Tax=Anneissia japonica TaxID=1529436 RepID=UPI001425B050|nr:uncharacterized protein LOC117101360 [Anneissia japonica]